METNLRTDKLLDQIGWRLLQELQINGRLSYAELGRRVGLTTPAVVERVKRMEEAGIIVGYHADIDPMKVGMPITAFIRMSVVGDVFTRITAVVKNSPEVVLTGNIYPGVLRVGGTTFGLWGQLLRDHQWRFGIVPNFGLGVGRASSLPR